MKKIAGAVLLQVTMAMLTVADDGSAEARVLFSTERIGGTLSLYSMKPDGKDKRLHVPAEVRRRGEYEASVSPDGTKIAFTTYRYGGWKVAVSDIDGSNVRRVTLDPQYAYDPHWAPDGKSLIYRRIVNNGGAYFRGKGDIFQINLDGSGNRNLSRSDDGHDRNPAYSPDGRHILYDSFVGEKLRLFLMSNDGTDRQQIADHLPYMFAPSWSPDGERIAYLGSDEEGHIDVWVSAPDGSTAVNLTNAKEKGYGVTSEELRHWQFETSWSPDGKHIAFVGDYLDNGNADIYVIATDGSNLRRLTQDSGSDLHPYWYRPANR